jgi:hypothetical protein
MSSVSALSQGRVTNAAHTAAASHRCKAIRYPTVKTSRLKATVLVSCKAERRVVKRWIKRSFTRRGVRDGIGNVWFCDFTASTGRNSRKADCIAGKDGFIRFRVRY